MPDNYFQQQALLITPEPEKNHQLSHDYSGGYYNFSHIAPKIALLQSTEQIDKNAIVHNATLQYEQALRYYVDGLRYADSPYAFFTIGSILIFNTAAYAKVRGFPKKSAGEDFYLLNKLAKIGRIAFLSNSCVELTSRLSTRVPFGTGPAVQQIMTLSENNSPYCYYSPAVFDELKHVNHKIKRLLAYEGVIPVSYTHLTLPTKA